ncbi:MAG: Flagellar hook-length control protein FliK [uncultured Chloroflexia bacterium]|uniref:Flagellar hook-length control protein FliK n=1 Tax=uncultured Chloroflexia bacterium TaxID=1672391 RepID=A0A6J4ISS4_9CHLR|nr:MAG: Flagellar hook-length control protein FliK [uncultured Chloroflexia bacterium]
MYGANVVATNTSGLNYGIVAATSSPDGYAGYFGGRVHVSGTLSKSAGSFKIDHPLDPTNKYLSHSFVESPDMMNIYNGNATLDAKGEALITMPDWFEALNMEFRYQLTCIGGYAPVYIAQEISKNQFKIAGGKSGLKVSWQVTGVRQDAYAKAHRIPLEEDKPVAERGRLLNPEVFGKPATQSVMNIHAPQAPRDQAPLQSMPEVPKPPTPERVKPIDPESRR